MICENLKRGIIHSGKKERRQLPSLSGFEIIKRKPKNPKCLMKLTQFDILSEYTVYRINTFTDWFEMVNFKVNVYILVWDPSYLFGLLTCTVIRSNLHVFLLKIRNIQETRYGQTMCSTLLFGQAVKDM